MFNALGWLWIASAVAGTSPRDAVPEWQWADEEGDGAWGEVLLLDVDGDHVKDVIVSDPIVNKLDRSLDEPGRVLVFKGGAHMASTPTWELGLSGTEGHSDAFGVWGDIDGDSIADQVTWVGDPDAGNLHLGIRWGTHSGPSATIQPLVLEREADVRWYRDPLPVARIADINGDGFGDLVMQAHEFDGVPGMMHVAIHLGHATGFDAEPVWERQLVDLQGNRWDGLVGGDVVILDDIDLDGPREVIFTIYSLDDEDGAWRASFTMYRGDPVTALRDAFWTSHYLFDQPLTAPSGVQLQIQPVGDLSFSGLPDTLMMVNAAPGEPWRVWLYKGSVDYGYTLDSPFELWTGTSTERAPRLLGVGDFDGDGSLDAALGQPGRLGASGQGQGVIDLYLAGGTAFPIATRTNLEPSVGEVGFGAFGAMGDLNGDGKADLVTGSSGDLATGVVGDLQIFRGYRDYDGDGFDDVLDDCDPLRADVYPGAEDVWYDGVDANCDGANDYDQDGDGAELEDDCDDLDDTIYYGAKEVWYDGIDQDCDGNDGDRDEDGHDSPKVGGDDCDDRNPRVNPGMTEVVDNGLDDDCVDGDQSSIVPLDKNGCGCSATSSPTTAWLWAFAGLALLGRRRGSVSARSSSGARSG